MTENILKIFKSIIPKPVFNFFQPIYHFFISLAGRIMYGRSGKSMFVIGVTGTKGKTTAIELINTILEEAGEKTALLSSVYRKVGEKREKKKSPNTMPGRLYIPKFLKEAEEAGCKYAILEVTSQGVVQFAISLLIGMWECF
jgi:UDP-N-acetylmuramoyl-L-alanyl-D-glutamate--2,6-diaminopimelate ligase